MDYEERGRTMETVEAGTSIGNRFRAWVHQQRPANSEVVVRDENRMVVTAGELVAQVNFYPLDDDAEIVEYRINRAEEDEPLFFLHFALDDMERAQELFAQMVEVLEERKSHVTTRVLLCCTSGLTTTLFANKMGEAAKTLSLDYEFSAMPVDRALVDGGEYSAILLAPQASHMRRQMRKAHPNTLVFEIPAKVFGAYDAGSALRLLMHAFRDAQDAGRRATLKAVRDLSDDRQVLIITLFSMRGYHRLGYRLYNHGVGVTEGSVRKPRLDFRDIDDLIGSLALRGIDADSLDAVAIAVPGVTYRGSVTLPNLQIESHELGVHLSQRLGIPVFVDNNCNAAAVGCYVSQREARSLVFYRHAFGHEAGGFGTLIDGMLLKGHHNLAGEPKYFEPSFAYTMTYEETMWSADGMHELALNVVCAAIALIAPDAVYLAVDTVDDAEEFRSMLLEVFEDAYVPQVYVVSDYVERVYLGTLAMALQRLRDPKHRSLGVS